MTQGPGQSDPRETLMTSNSSPSKIRRLWLPGIVALAALVALLLVGKEMGQYRTELRAGPQRADLMSLQLAFSQSKGERILADWASREPAKQPSDLTPPVCGPRVTACARKNIELDRWFIFAYAIFGFAFLTALLRLMEIPFNRSWLIASLLPTLAAALDIGENLLHLRLLDDPSRLYLVTWASLFAGVKLLLLGFVLMLVVAVLGFWLFGQPRAKPSPPESKVKLADLAKVMEKEAEYLNNRRKLVTDPPIPTHSPWIGLAMSGGGIRSATVNLGVLQVLLGSSFFRRIDYLSSVSGGGYIGSTLSSLLSFRKKDGAGDVLDEHQYEFRRPEDEPHFDTSAGKDNPFDPRLSTRRQPWLSGRMVTQHLLAYGEFLVRRRRLLSLDLLRAIGTFASGIGSMLVLFILAMLLVAAVTATLIESSGVDLSSGSYRELGAYWNILWGGIGGIPGLLRVSAFGALAALAILWACAWTVRRTPPGWFERDGDTVAESQQHRALWIAGGTIAVLGLIFVGPVASIRSPTPGLATLLTIPGFFLGSLVMTALARVALSVSGIDLPGLRSNPTSRSYVSGSNGLSLNLFVLGTAIALLPWAYTAVQGLSAVETRSIGSIGTFAAVASGILAWLQNGRTGGESQLKTAWGWLKASGGFLQKLALGVAVAVLLTMALFLALAALIELLGDSPTSNPGWTKYFWWGTGIAAVLLALGFILDFNRLSLHYFYRDRLVDAYLRTDGRVKGSKERHLERKRDNSEMRLTQLQGVLLTGEASGQEQQRVKTTAIGRMNPFADAPKPVVTGAEAATAAPYHLICTCLNLTSDRDMHLRSRRSDVFLFSKLFCGSDTTGFVDAALYRSGATKLARAVTISGAAADSALGRQTFFAQSFATTLFNIRLGQWLENPRYRDGRHVHLLENRVFWPKYLLKEVFGISDSRSRLVHLSDGGHTGDNLGIMPLLQRRCRLVVAVDAESDPEHRFGSLMNALQYAQVDLDIEIDMDLSGLELDNKGLTAKHLAIGYIRYPPTESPKREASRGILIYLKSSVAAVDGEPESIRQYRKTHPKFPHETTADQFFSEAQFEAYRNLGRALARSMIDEYSDLNDAGSDTERIVERIWEQRTTKSRK